MSHKPDKIVAHSTGVRSNIAAAPDLSKTNKPFTRMHRTVIALLMWLLIAEPASAETQRLGLDGSRENDIKDVTVTEYAPGGRTVKLTTPNEVKAFVQQFETWSMSVPQKWKRDFFNKFPVRYTISVRRAASAYTLYLAIRHCEVQKIKGQPLEPSIEFVLFTPEKDGSFTVYLEGVLRTLNAQDTPFECYLAKLFPPAK